MEFQKNMQANEHYLNFDIFLKFKIQLYNMNIQLINCCYLVQRQKTSLKKIKKCGFQCIQTCLAVLEVTVGCCTRDIIYKFVDTIFNHMCVFNGEVTK